MQASKLFRIRSGVFILTSIALVSMTASAVDHTLLTRALQSHVKDGKVDYPGIKADERFQLYIAQLQRTDTSMIRPEEKMAFWINVYNAYTIKIVTDYYPIGSIMDLNTGGKLIAFLFGMTVWDKDWVFVGNVTTSLNTIEHKILRPMGDARVHFALVCAARSCPPLRPEAYDSEELGDQLNDQGRIFLAESSKNRVDVAGRKVYLSKIFDWYEEDFVTKGATVLDFIIPFLSPDLRTLIQANQQEFEIGYSEYDWSLNE